MARLGRLPLQLTHNPPVPLLLGRASPCAGSTVRLKDRPARPGSFRRSSVASMGSTSGSSASVALLGPDAGSGVGGGARRYQRCSLASMGSSGNSLTSFTSHLGDSPAAHAAAGSPLAGGGARRYERCSLVAMAAVGSSSSWSGTIEVTQRAQPGFGSPSGGVVLRGAARRLSAPPCAGEQENAATREAEARAAVI